MSVAIKTVDIGYQSKATSAGLNERFHDITGTCVLEGLNLSYEVTTSVLSISTGKAIDQYGSRFSLTGASLTDTQNRHANNYYHYFLIRDINGATLLNSFRLMKVTTTTSAIPEDPRTPDESTTKAGYVYLGSLNPLTVTDTVTNRTKGWSTNFNTTGSASIGGNVNIQGDAFLSSDLDVDGKITTDDFESEGDSEFNNITVNGNLNLSGTASFVNSAQVNQFNNVQIGTEASPKYLKVYGNDEVFVDSSLRLGKTNGVSTVNIYGTTNVNGQTKIIGNTTFGDITQTNSQQQVSVHGKLSTGNHQVTSANGEVAGAIGFSSTALGEATTAVTVGSVAEGRQSLAIFAGTNTSTNMGEVIGTSTTGASPNQKTTITVSGTSITSINTNDTVYIKMPSSPTISAVVSVKETSNGNTVLTLDKVYTNITSASLNVSGGKTYVIEPATGTGLGYCKAEGIHSISVGVSSHAEGVRTLASARAAHAEGELTVASGISSHAEGFGAISSGKYSFANGYRTIAISGSSGVIVGFNNVNKTIFFSSESPVGNFSDFMVVLNDGSAPIMLSSGVVTTPDGLSYTVPVYNYKTTTPYTGEISSDWIVAIGAIDFDVDNLGYASIATGGHTISSGKYSFSAGEGTIASGSRQAVFGAYNKESISYFTVGKGTGNTARSNAFRVSPDGKCHSGDGFTTTNSADYAEMFEWYDGNSNNEDRVGYFVTLDDSENIKIASDIDEYILGVISASPAILADSGSMEWKGQFLRDEWGRILTEEIITDTGEKIIRQKINPDYDHTRSYIPREQRPEWSPVGMLGKLYVRDDGTCEVGKYCKPNQDGVATKSDAGYRVISRVNENIVRIIFK